MPIKLRFFWLKIPKIFPDARRVARIVHTDGHLKNLQWLLMFQLHVRRLCVRRSKYLVLRPVMTVHGLRAGTGAVASSSALNYGGVFWNSSNSLADGSSTENNNWVIGRAVCPASASVAIFLFEICSICPWKGSVRRDHLHVYPIFTGNPYSDHDASWLHLMSLFLLSKSYPEQLS